MGETKTETTETDQASRHSGKLAVFKTLIIGGGLTRAWGGEKPHLERGKPPQKTENLGCLK